MHYNENKKILIVDDESEMRAALETTLKREGYDTRTAEDGMEALKFFENNHYDVVISDVKMPHLNGVDLLRAIKQKSPSTHVIMMTAYGDIDNAVEAMRTGAYDYLLKPFSADILISTINRAFMENLAAPGVSAPVAQGQGQKKSTHARKIITQNPEMKALLKLVENVAYSKSTVLIIGETGTGKEMIARYIHQCSPRANKAFIPINCAAMPEGLLETEMFGHEKGAFTGATSRKEGKFELASKGTLLLDEVTEMPLPLQAKLLRVLQEHEIDKVGGREPIPVDVRVVATTNRNIKSHVQENLFREDLYYRLNVIPIKLIPLRERKEDIPLLAQHFLQEHCKENHKSIRDIDPATLDMLKQYRWPGNIRELGNIIERGVLMCQGERLLPSHLLFDDSLTFEKTEPTVSTSFAEGLNGTIYDMEKELILKTLKDLNDNKTRTAAHLGISIRTLRNKLNDYQKHVKV